MGATVFGIAGGQKAWSNNPIWSIDWLAGPKIGIVDLCFALHETGETIHLKLYLSLSGSNKHQLQLKI